LRERERERERERKARRCKAAETNEEKEERRKTARTNSFLELKKNLLKVKKYYFNDIGKIKRICYMVFLYKKKNGLIL
jgi:hypothetical protein